MDFLSFLALSVLFTVIPGPNVLIIVATALRLGKIQGLRTVAGTSLAMACQLLVAAIGTGSVIALLSSSLIWLKWIGVLYLLYLGCSSLVRFARKQTITEKPPLGSFQQGFIVSLTNPKTLMFFVAFLPQFVSSEADYSSQIFILSSCFLLIAICIDSGYVFMSELINRLIEKERIERWQDGVAGGLFLAASAVLAASHK